MKVVKTHGKTYRVIGCGCSHTQASAFATSGDNPEWINSAVAEKYPVECNHDFITNNLTWMSKMKPHLNIHSIVNFGFAGSGTTSVLRALKNFIAKEIVFDDLLVIVQVAYPLRDEIHFRPNVDTNWSISNLKEILKNEGKVAKYPNFNFQDFVNTYTNNLYNPKFRTLDYLYELYYFQQIFEKLGGDFRVFMAPFFKLELSISDIQTYEAAHYKRYTSLGYERDIQGILSPIKLLTKLNFIDVKLSTDEPYTLASDNLVPNDDHLSEQGNKFLGHAIVKSLNTPYDLKLT